MRFLWLIFLFLFSCKGQVEQQKSFQLSDDQKFTFLDSIAASQQIIIDNTEGFFEKITSLDMSIQMKRNYPEQTSREKILEDYLTFLQEDVESFSPNEIFLIEGIMHRLYKLCSKLNVNLFPPEIKLIKTKGGHYGDGVFYTRDNMIIIPKNELEDFNADLFTAVMAHEIAHIFSRNNPKTKEAMYEMIGFKKLNCTTEELLLPEDLRKRILLNPDGVDYTYAIKLQASRDSFFWALPILASNFTSFDPDVPEFFNYIDFQLYPLKEMGKDTFEVIKYDYGEETINPYFRDDFLKQIKDNTDYIIHPDEIMADNFKLLVLSKTGSVRYNPERLSKEGARLLNELEFLLMNH